jgi:hypothetical protein
MPPQGQGIAALMMLNIMERFPLGEWGFHDPRSMHVMIEAKKLAYADMLRYVGDPKFSRIPVSQMLSREHASARAANLDLTRAACDVMPAQIAGLERAHGGDTVYLTVIDADGNIVSLIQSISDFRHRTRAPGPVRAATRRPFYAGSRSVTAGARKPPARSSLPSWRRTAYGSDSIMAAGPNRRRTPSSSPTSSTTA